VQASLSGESWNAEGITYEVSANIDDPFGRAEQAFLLLKRWQGEQAPTAIEPTGAAAVRLEVPPLREVRRLTLPVDEKRSMPPRQTVQMALSREGLVVNLLNSRAPDDLWVIDEEDLHVTHRVSVPSISLTTAPSLSTAYLITVVSRVGRTWRMAPGDRPGDWRAGFSRHRRRSRQRDHAPDAHGGRPGSGAVSQS
jgi:hypothetical protein